MKDAVIGHEAHVPHEAVVKLALLHQALRGGSRQKVVEEVWVGLELLVKNQTKNMQKTE